MSYKCICLQYFNSNDCISSTNYRDYYRKTKKNKIAAGDAISSRTSLVVSRGSRDILDLTITWILSFLSLEIVRSLLTDKLCSSSTIIRHRLSWRKIVDELRTLTLEMANIFQTARLKRIPDDLVFGFFILITLQDIVISIIKR